MKSVLLLEDGTLFEGSSFGARGAAFGEVVFNTSMTGYQEILTDPSYKGQMVTMTYPLIGNYGVSKADNESIKPFCHGFIVRENSRTQSSWRSCGSLDDFLKEKNVVGISGIDTRALTRHLRDKGSMRGVISSDILDKDQLMKMVLDYPSIVGLDLVKEVSCLKAYKWEEGRNDLTFKPTKIKKHFDVVVFDFGAKHNILRKLYSLGCNILVVPADTSAEEIMKIKPDGIMLSNGPGDPQAVDYAVETMQKLAGKFPIFGICLGHQILSLAFGGKTFKLKFGHRGGNHPVKDLRTGKVEITSQNHGFAVDPDSFMNRSIELTHINLNDGTCEGFAHKHLPVFAVQYHPEASPGPHDSDYLFDKFIDYMKKG